MSEEEVAAIALELDRVRAEIEEPLSRIEQRLDAGEPVPLAVRNLARNLRAALVRFDLDA
jgi:nucleotide-binding universal stress UspA family protein